MSATGLQDLDPSLRLVSGRENLALALARRFMSPGLFYAPDYGVDLRAWLGEPMTAGRLARLRAAIAAQAVRDERVESAGATVEFNTATRTLTVRLALVDAAGPFERVLSVTAAGGVVLEPEAGT